MTTTELHGARFAARAAGYHPSPVRDVFEISMQPGMISLAGGNPDLAGLALDDIAAMAGSIISDNGLDALQYGSGAGTSGLHELVCRVAGLEGTQAAPENVQITTGSQMGLELVTKMFCDPGDVIIAEGPTYVGAIGTFEGLQVEIAHVSMDHDGLLPAELRRRIQQLQKSGKRIKFLYTIPNFNNPAGVTLALDRRQEIVEICRAADIAIIEDNPYGLLGFDGRTLPSLHSLDPENVFHLGSMSKIFSPGIRIGWIIAPADVRRRLQLAAEATSICPSVLSQMLAERYFTTFPWEEHLTKLRALYSARCAATLEALDEYMPAGTSWTNPSGGFFTWVTLPDGCSTEELLPAAIERGVVFVPGSAFFNNGAGRNQFRIAFSFESTDTLREGVRRLGEAIKALPTTEGTA